jgi:phosphodiesterase/alkaline phosphatase D-like protein
LRHLILNKLNPTRIEFPISGVQANEDLKYQFNFTASTSLNSTASGEGRFTVPPKEGELWDHEPKIAITSCNDVTRDCTGDLKLWKALSNEKTDIKFFLGDQIYGDDVAFPISYDSKHVWADTDNLTLDVMRDRYNDLYRLTYNLCQTGMRDGINIMLPDDHEGYDSLGTPNLYDFADEKRSNAMKAAYDSLQSYQLQLRSDYNPDKIIDVSDIYFFRKWGDIECVGVDTRFDRFPSIWKKAIFDQGKDYEAEPVWISHEQTKFINDIVDEVKSNKPKYLIVAISTPLCHSSSWAVNTLNKVIGEFAGKYNHPRSKEEFYKFLTKLFEASKDTHIVAINGSEHQASLSSWQDLNNNKFCEITSSAITREPSNMMSLLAGLGIAFFGSWALTSIFRGQGVNDYKVNHQDITFGNNITIAQLGSDKVKTKTYVTGPTGYFESFLTKIGLRSYNEDLKEILVDYDYTNGEIAPHEEL